MTAPAITANDQVWTSGGIKYKSVLAQKRWKRDMLTATRDGGSVVETMLAPGTVTPAKLNLSTTFASTPPGTPIGKYIITATATGAWVGKEDYIAEWIDGAWAFTAPVEGMLVWNAATDDLYGYDGSDWVLANNYVLPDRLSIAGKQITDWNDALEFGMYWGSPTVANPPPGTAGTLFSSGLVLPVAATGSVEQIASVWDADNDTTATYSRTLYAGNWGAWVKRNLSLAEITTLITDAIANYDVLPEATRFTVKSASTSAPPGSPASGDRYIVKQAGTGVWAGHDLDLAEWDGAQWVFTDLAEGIPFWVADTDQWVVYNGTSLIVVGPAANMNDWLFRYMLTDSTGTKFGPVNLPTDYSGQPWTAVFPDANVGSGTQYVGFGTIVAGGANVNVGPEAVAIRVGTQNYWLYSASYSAASSPYTPGSGIASDGPGGLGGA